MDRHRGLVLGLALAIATAAGCVTTKQDGIVPKAPTCVAFGDLRSSTALNQGLAPEQRQVAREEARGAYLKAIEVDPKHLPAYLALARLHRACDDTSAALSTYQEAIKLADRSPVLWHEMAMCHCKARQWEAGVAGLKKAVELDPNNRQYASALGYALVMAGHPQDGLAVLARLNGEAKAHLEMARLMQHANQLEQARLHLAEAARLDPTLPELSSAMAQHDATPSREITQTRYIAPPTAPAPAAPPTVIQAGTTQPPQEINLPSPPVLSIRSR